MANQRLETDHYFIQQTINKIKDRIAEHENELYALMNLRRATKKDGKPFVRLGDNYPDAKVTIERTLYGVISGINISGSIGPKTSLHPHGAFVSTTIYIRDEPREETFECCEGLIHRRIEELFSEVNSYKKQLKAAKPAFQKVSKSLEKVMSAIESIPEANDSPYHTTLGYALFEYARRVLY